MPFQIVSNLNPVVVNMTGGFVGSITGNTAGVPAVISSGTQYLAGGNNITLSQNGNTVSIIGGAGGGGGIANAAGTQTATSGTVVFSNSNNVTFGMSNSSIVTASASFNQTAQTQNLHNVSLSGNTAGVMAQVSSGTMTLAGGNNITLSQNGNAVTISGPNTVAQTAFVFSNSNGVSFGTNGSTVTATVATNYQSQGAYLTTARASTDAIGLNTAFTNVTATANSSGLSINASGYAGTNSTFNGTNISGSITQNSNGLRLDLSVAPGGGAGDGYNIIGVNGAGTSASTTLQLSNSNNVSFGLNAGTITASASFNQSVQTQGMVSVNGSTGNISFATGSSLSSSSNGSTITFGLASNITTALQSANANYLTSQSNQAFSASGGSSTFQTLNFANSNGITFSNSNGSVIASHNGLTTAMASNRGTDFVQATAAFAGTNASGTIASNGISVSVAAPGAAAENNWFNLGGNTAGNTTASGSTIQLIGGANITLSGTNGSQISIVGGGGGGAGTLANWEPFQANNGTTFSSLGQNSLYLQKLLPNNNYSFNNFELRMSGSYVSSTNSQVAAHTINYGLYSKNGASYSSIATSQMIMQASFNSSTAVGFTVSQGAGSYTNSSNASGMVSLYTGFKHLYLPFTSTLTAGGQYALGLHISSATTVGTSPMRMAILNQSVINNLTIGKIFATTVSASNASFVEDFAQGVLSATTGAMPTSVAESQLTNAASQQRLYIQLD